MKMKELSSILSYPGKYYKRIILGFKLVYFTEIVINIDDNNSHLLFAHAKQLIVHLSNDIDNLNVLTSQLFEASLFKILRDLIKKSHNMFKGCKFYWKGLHPQAVKNANTLGILKGFFAAYSHNFTIFLSLGEPSCIHKLQSNWMLLSQVPTNQIHGLTVGYSLYLFFSSITKQLLVKPQENWNQCTYWWFREDFS